MSQQLPEIPSPRPEPTKAELHPGEDFFSPRKLLQARRPEKFSDSVTIRTAALDRSLLEYYLGSLTNRKQETDFERLAKRLIERTVCPNLLPQTGPTGGGDSKVDSETYPVPDDLSLVWYVGNARKTIRPASPNGPPRFMDQGSRAFEPEHDHVRF
jgi:hypothetical protein